MPVLLSVAARLDSVICSTPIQAAARASSGASAVCGRAKLSCIFNPRRLSCNWINEKRYKRTDRLKQEKGGETLQILVAQTEVRAWTFCRLLPLWKHGCTGEQPSSLPGVPVWCWPFSLLVEEVLQLLPTVGGETKRTVNTRLVCIAMGKCWSLQVWIYMGLSLVDRKVFWRSNSKANEGNIKSSVLPGIRATGLPNTSSAAGRISPPYQEDWGEGLRHIPDMPWQSWTYFKF